MNRNVLLVEDENDICDVMKAQLELQGHNITTVNDGREALSIIQSNGKNFDLIILDRMLPGTNGLEICKFIRMFEKTRHIPILMVTALTRPEDVIEGLNEVKKNYY